MANETMKITVDFDYDFESMEDVREKFNEETIVEIVNRWCQTARSARKYRQSAQEKNKAIKAQYEAAVKAGLIKPVE